MAVERSHTRRLSSSLGKLHSSLIKGLKGMSEVDSHRSSINILAIINTAFTKIRVDQKLQPRLWNKWLPAEIWVEALETSNLIDEALALNVRNFNTAMARSKSEFNVLLIERFDGSNTTGVFRVTFQKQKY